MFSLETIEKLNSEALKLARENKPEREALKNLTDVRNQNGKPVTTSK